MATLRVRGPHPPSPGEARRNFVATPTHKAGTRQAYGGDTPDVDSRPHLHTPSRHPVILVSFPRAAGARGAWAGRLRARALTQSPSREASHESRAQAQLCPST
ncbi:hypothetical protein ABZP36_005118 [Zizania latifolia]